jgi:hypothetical protein
MRNGRITTKSEMYRLLYGGRFGNYPRAWESLEAVLASGYGGHVSIRSLQTSNPVKLYHVPAAELSARVAALPPAHRDAGLVFSESPDDSKRTIQGEWDGFSLTYSFFKAPMRLAFERELLHAEGPRARWLLKHYLDAADYEWLDDLIRDFPGHVVEFSGFSCRVGTHRRRCIFWEVRYY